MKRILFVLALVFVVPVNASAQAPFYQDKTIRIVAGYGAGSVDDASSRDVCPRNYWNAPMPPASLSPIPSGTIRRISTSTAKATPIRRFRNIHEVCKADAPPSSATK